MLKIKLMILIKESNSILLDQALNKVCYKIIKNVLKDYI